VTYIWAESTLLLSPDVVRTDPETARHHQRPLDCHRQTASLQIFGLRDMEVDALSALTVGVLMNRRNFLVLALLGALMCSPGQVGYAQLGFSEPQASGQDPLVQVLNEGRRLELDERWGEALTTMKTPLDAIPTTHS
jgi:hypothetical protein